MSVGYNSNSCHSLKARNSAGIDRAYTNGRNKKNKHSCGESIVVDRIGTKAQPIYYGCK